ncbi:MAG: RimK family alpha-L-glutamate ligase [Nanoarchaeota archaeon]|nr:RimK family alpha-L-glutamate ligase [Nanoarchaeota archaeon]MBU1321441.1 RimK family alpha-L-glutamate ligase [Nanoarchaeota archaeon]MBU1596897.1 RimK family alpha-L-glutamate ligase [Nanoarchaeota archaeon]MBU2441566.1 RimK family alpha-L-glutamate ligase [Nanoarchaeota archaeon]
MSLKAAIISLGSESSEWTVEAMRKYFSEVDDLDIRQIEINISGKSAEILYNGKPIPKYDCVYAKGSFRYAPLLKTLTSVLENKCYVPISSDAYTIAHDKLLTHLELQKHNISMPKTYVSATIAAAKKILEKINYPIIMKFPHGTGGKGVMFADSYASASSLLDALTALRQPFIIQEYIETKGTDVRAIVVGNKIIASYKRKAGLNEVRSNFHSGGSAEPIELDSNTKRIAINTAKAIKADICAVDMLESSKGALVIEANISPGLQLITKTTQIDVADKIAKYLYERTLEFKTRDKELKSAQIMKGIDKETTADGKRKFITNLDFRGNKILLPEIISQICDFDSEDNYDITAEPDKVVIKKLKIKKDDD